MYLKIEEVLARNKIRGYGYDENHHPRALTSKEFYEISCELGLNQDNSEYRRLFENFSKWISRNLKAKTALEIGSGPGCLLYFLNKIGITTHGTDGNTFSRDYFVSKHPELSSHYHLDPFFEHNYEQVDLLISIEVFEHINDDGLASVFKKIREQVRPKIIVFSSTPYADPNAGWDEQWGHINMKPTEKWDELFSQNGFTASKMQVPITAWARLYISDSITSEPRYNRLLEKKSWLGSWLA
jgi:2-polyprenyl-3-methyl-5-hydroxy-6-metoxy-1,4-benzoquinol methylase